MLPGTKPSVLAATVATTRARVESLGATLVADVLCAHQTSAVARALSQMSDQGLDPILILGASAIVDRRDVVPAAVTTCGGEVLHLGMPVDPGNLLMLASLGGASVVGLPGCARSPKLNGFDWVLQRLVAGLAVTSRDIMGMGVGGLLTEIGSRPMPRRTAALDPADAVLREPAIAAVILAAGRSTRMGGTNKMLSLVGGRPLIVGAVEAALASRARPVVVVVGHQADAVRQVLTGMPVSIVDNHDFVAGVSTSIAAGLAAVPAGSDGAVFMLADMPRVKALHIDRLIAAFHPGEGRSICIASHRGKRGNPVLWARRYFPEMAALEGDVGARALFARHGEEICEVEMADDGVLVDIDSPEALTALDPGDPVSAVSGEPASV
jgi:molybdenum cofactor cytidylyltransferase